MKCVRRGIKMRKGPDHGGSCSLKIIEAIVLPRNVWKSGFPQTKMSPEFLKQILIMSTRVPTENSTLIFRSVPFSCSVVSISLRPHEPQHARPPCPSPTPRVHPTHVHWVGDAIQPSHLPLSPSPPALNLSPHPGLFQWVSSFIRWPKYRSFSFNISPSNEHPGLITYRMDWLDLLAVQGTLMGLLQHHSSKSSILLCSAFFIVQLSHPYMTTG